MMRSSLVVRWLVLSLALAPLFAACGDDDSTSPDDPLVALVGSYTTQSFVYTAVANPAITVDLADIGAGITALTVNADGSFDGSATLVVGGSLQSIEADGTLSDITNNSLTINFEGLAAQVLPNPLPVSYTLNGNVLSFIASVNFDYSIISDAFPPGDTPSTLSVVLLKS